MIPTRISRGHRLGLAASLLLASAVAATSVTAEDRAGRLTLDPHHTVVAFHLGSRLHDVHGTFAVREGALTVDAATGAADGTVIVDATSGESGNASRDGRMASAVLESAHFPEIRFRATHVDGGQRPDGTFSGTLHGVLTLHGAEHPLAVAIDGRVVGDELTAHGRFSVPYIAWGLADPSVLMLTVAQTVDVDVTTTGHVQWQSTTPTSGGT